MKFFALFIHRPVASWLICIAIFLCGVLSFRLLPVSPLPSIDLPVISVSASLSGADPETMASAVAAPLEAALGSIAGLDEMTSSNSLGSTRITLVFDISKNINSAAKDVQAAINAAMPMLPAGMINPPSFRKFNPSDAPIMILSLTSAQHTLGELYNIANTQIAPQLAQVEGVGDVSLGGSTLPAIRIQLNPQAIFNQGLSLQEIARTINTANPKRPLGWIDGHTQQWQINTNDQLETPEDYQQIVLRHNPDQQSNVLLTDVARVFESTQNERNIGMSDGKPAILLIITRSQDANIIGTVDRIKARVPELQSMLDKGVSLNLAQDRSPTIRASLQEVEQSMIIAVLLVILVVFLFLRSAHATLIPAIVVPISLIGSFSAMYLLGFSLNNLSLMALTIATGFVVDDAIVIVENIARHTEKGLSPFNAAIKGVKEVGFTVTAISLSLIAVFIPLLLAPGIQGKLFLEFAATLSIAILISLFISLTLTPMLSARLLTNHNNSSQTTQKPSSFLKDYLNKLYHYAIWLPLNLIKLGLNKLQAGYLTLLKLGLKHAWFVMLLFFSSIGLTLWLFISLPKTFFPEQDTGRIVAFIRADQSTSFQSMAERLETFMTVVKNDPAVVNVSGFTGGNRTNSANMFISLKPLSEREPIVQVIGRLRDALKDQAGATLFMVPVQDFRTGGRQGNASYQYTLLSDDVSILREWEPKIRKALSELAELEGVDSDQQDGGSEIRISYDRDTLSRLGISISDTNALLNSAYGQRTVSTIYDDRNQYQVVMEVLPEYTQDESSLSQMYLINKEKNTVPLESIATWQPSNAPLSVNHQQLSAATTISFNLPEGGSLSDATQSIERAMTAIGVPSNIQGSFAGTAKLFQENTTTQILLILAAIVTVYLVLGILYESFIHPFTILSTLPAAGVGALLGLKWFDAPFSLIALIGILLLIGIVKKNAIMLIDFALSLQREKQLDARSAIYQACEIRFRPILMTSLAAICGAIPLMLGQGDGAELRQPLGITIVGGLLMSQLLTLFTTPVIYLFFERCRAIFTRKRLA